MTQAPPSTARIEANRRNSRRSTGPKSLPGKALVSKNALQHGLAAPLSTEDKGRAEIRAHVDLLVSGELSEPQNEAVFRFVEAQLDLVRIRRERARLMQQIFNRETQHEITVGVVGGSDPWPAIMKLVAEGKAQQAISDFVRMQKVEVADAMAKRLSDAIVALSRVDRYERRALSRRKHAMRRIEAMQISLKHLPM